jgi:hypothetical protein
MNVSYYNNNHAAGMWDIPLFSNLSGLVFGGLLKAKNCYPELIAVLCQVSNTLAIFSTEIFY